MEPEYNSALGILNPRSEKIQEEFKQVDDVNSMLLDAIKAKLAILDHQNVGENEQGDLM